jgi:RNA polymerase sigma-70 factor (ECF subfamily)
MAESVEPQSDANRLHQLLAQDRERLISIANRFVRDRHEAEDIVQETVTAVWQRLSEIDPDKLANYLSRSVRQNALKRKSRKREFVVLDGLAETWTTPDARLADPIDLEDTISALPLLQQNVIRMKYYFGMTFRQIGSALSISTDTAASRCRYALAKLQKMLKAKEKRRE